VTCVLCHRRPSIGKPADVQIDACEVCFRGCPDCGAVSENGWLCDYCSELEALFYEPSADEEPA
jgi:hypothetical protein